MKKNKVFLLMLTFLLLSLFVSVGSQKINALTTSALGSVKYTYSRNILKDMKYTYTESNNGSPQRAYVMEYNPKTSGVEALAMFGEYLYGGDTISTNIALAKRRGYTVIAGVNASPFDTSNGVTVGTTIQNGRIVVSKSGELSTEYDNVAFCKDGSPYIGHPNFEFSYTSSSGANVKINYLNRPKKEANNNVYLFSRDLYSDTRNTNASCEVVLKIDSGDLIVGTEIKCTVEKVNENATKTAIEEGKYVLVGPSLSALGNLKVGETVTISIKDNDPNFDWSKVEQTISGFYQILKDGKSTPRCENTVHPRTTIGYRADGTVVVYVADGRQPSVAVGMTDFACAQYMAELGCINAVRMDGGGSSNLSLRLPGDTGLTTVNVPSDGQERNDADCFLFVLKEDYVTTPDDTLMLHAYPNDLKVLQGTVVDIKVKATDNNYNPKETPEYNLIAATEIGSIVDGKFKAKEGSGTGNITITSGSAITTVNVNVTNKVDELYASVNNLALSPSEEVSLGVNAYYQNDLLECSNEAFTWKCDAGLGTIDNTGHFKASDEAGKNGYIYINYGNIQAKVVVTIGQLPYEITGFETDQCGNKSGQWRNNQAGSGGSATLAINEDLDFVRFGNKSLQLNVNLKNTTGTVGAQINTGTSLTVKGTPTAIGMWVYATKEVQGAWLRIQYYESGSSGAKYSDLTPEGEGVNWIGWKYLEAKLDTTVKYPVSIQYLLRIMAVKDNERVEGTFYVDGLRAVYGFTNDDLKYPELTNLNTLDGGVINDTTHTISFDAIDEGTGINKQATKFYLNGEEITNLNVKDIQGGYNYAWTPSALIAYNKGENKVSIRIEDNFGNFVYKDITFTVDNSLPSFSTMFTNDELELKGKDKITINATNMNFETLEFVMNYDKDKINIESISAKSDNITFEKTETEGKVKITISNNNFDAAAGDLIDINLVAIGAGDVNISFSDVVFKTANYDTSINISFNPFIKTCVDNLVYPLDVLDEILNMIDEFFK